MMWFPVLYFLFLFISFFFMGYVAFHAHRHRHVPGATAFMWVSLSVCFLSACECFLMISPTRNWALFWFNLRQISFSFGPVFWFVFILQYLGKSHVITRVRIAILCVIPVVTQAMVWTNFLHGWWVKRNVAFREVGQFYIADTSYRISGPWMYLHMFYTYTIVIMGMILLSILAVGLLKNDRRQAVAVGLGALILIIGPLFPTFNLMPGSLFNPLTVSMAAGSLVMAWGVFRYGFLAGVPVVEEGKRESILLMALFLTLTGIIIFSGYLYFHQFEINYRMEVERKLMTVATLKTEALVEWRKKRYADGEIFRENIIIVQLFYQIAGKPPNEDALNKMKNLLEKYQVVYRYKNVILLDGSSSPMVSARAVNNDEYRLAKRFMHDLKDWSRVHFLEFYTDAPDKQATMAILTPITDNGRRLGVIVFLMDPYEYVYPMLRGWPTPSKTGEILLARREGDRVLYLNDLKNQRNAALNLHASLNKRDRPSVMAVLGREGVVEGIDYQGKTVMAALKHVPNSPWFMAAQIDTEEIFAPLRERFWWMVFFVVVLITGAAGGVRLIWQRKIREFYLKEFESARALDVSEDKFRKAFMTSPDAVTITRLADGQVVSVNEGFLRITGYHEHEVVGKNVREIPIWANDQDRINFTGQIKRRLRVNNLDARFLTKNGDVVYTLMSASLIELDGVLHILMITRDITARKKAEDALRESERKLREAQEMARLGFWSWDIKTGTVEWSDEVFKIFGLNPKEFKPRIDAILALSPWPEDHQRDGELISRAVENHAPGSYEQKFLRPDQSVGYYHSTFQGVYDEQGDLVSIVGTVLDITERKLADERINRLNVELEQRVVERTAELAAKTSELERINKVFVNREIRMRELKEKIAELEKKNTEQAV